MNPIMTPERWRQISELVAAALELEPHQRAAFLDEKCAHDEQLRSDAASWLVSFERADNILDTPAAEIIAKDIAKGYARTILEKGQCLNHYRIIELLGKGGFGEVYKAQDTQLKRAIAIKVFSSIDSSEEGLLRFKQEAYAASRLKHPNIITIHAIGEVGSTPFIVTELVDGITLRERISQSQIGLREALEIATQLAHALVGAHKVGVVHRDIKPENIMLDTDGVVKILDFGVAKFIRQELSDSESQRRMLVHTESGIVIGSNKYMSPEQMLADEVDERSDIWSLGVVIYEMITGKVPFEGRTANIVSHRVLGGEPTPLSYYSSEVPTELHRIVARALRKDREQRFQTMKDLFTELESLKKQLDVDAFLRTKREQDEAQRRKRQEEEESSNESSASEVTIISKRVIPRGAESSEKASPSLAQGNHRMAEMVAPAEARLEEKQISLKQGTSPASDAVKVVATHNLRSALATFVRNISRHKTRILEALVIAVIIVSAVIVGRRATDERGPTNMNAEAVGAGNVSSPPPQAVNGNNRGAAPDRRNPPPHPFRLKQNLQGQRSTAWSVASSPDDELIASGSDDGKVRLWDAHTWRLLRTLDGDRDGIMSVGFSPNSRIIACANRSGKISVWDVSQGKQLDSLRGHQKMVNFVVFSPDKKLLASASKDKTIKLWDAQTWQEVRTLRGHDDVVWSAAFSPDSKVLASASKDHSIRLWDVGSGQAIKTLTNHKSQVVSLAFSPDGKLLATGSDDNTIKLWDTETWLEVRTLTGHQAYVTSLVFSPDSNYLVSASGDKTVRLWDVRSGKLLQTSTQHKREVTCVSFLHEGTMLISSSRDETVRIWQSEK
ncbi:MAG TPA: protein kinase [Pyrinomonadaceae bacterium]|nr:protein kinase [Pyrinomonadaceae bacterium]